MADHVTVLHVDDDQDFLELSAEFLERERGHIDVLTATSAGEGLETLDSEPVDCVVSDYQMPETDGLQFLEAVRVDHPNLPFILFTGKGSEELASDAISAGVTDYLQKDTGTDRYALLANRIEHAVERYVAEQEIRETRQRFRKLLSNAADYIHVLDAEGTVEYVTPSVERVLGYEPSALVGDDAFEQVHPEDLEAAVREFESILDEPGAEATAELRARHADGSWRWLEVRERNLLSDPVIGGVVGNVRDVTERKEQQAEIDWHRAIIRNMGEGVYVFDADCGFQFVTFRAEDLSGISETNWRGRHLSYLSDIGVLSDDEVADIEDAIQRLLAGEADAERLELRPSLPEEAEIVEIRLQPFSIENRGEFVLGTTRDITEQTERKRDLERQNERLEEFASIVSHDLRNPLNVVEGTLELAEETGDPEQFERCRRAARRMEELIDDLLVLARQGEPVGSREPVELPSVVEDCLDATDATDLDVDVETDRRLRADEGRLKQLIENLVGNAAEHGATSVVVGDCEEGFYVADDGPGIPPADREDVFEPGYTTAESGTGFGLAIVEQIANAHGWSVTVTESEAGGARFEIAGVETG